MLGCYQLGGYWLWPCQSTPCHPPSITVVDEQMAPRGKGNGGSQRNMVKDHETPSPPWFFPLRVQLLWGGVLWWGPIVFLHLKGQRSVLAALLPMEVATHHLDSWFQFGAFRGRACARPQVLLPEELFFGPLLEWSRMAHLTIIKAIILIPYFLLLSPYTFSPPFSFKYIIWSLYQCSICHPLTAAYSPLRFTL